MKAYQIPKRGETPSEEMIEFLNQNPLDWDGDDEGINLSVIEGENQVGFPGDWVVEMDGVYAIVRESEYKELEYYFGD